jgi:hypothetical protein
MSYYYDNAFGANRLAGGYLRIGPPQLSALPIRLPLSGPGLVNKNEIVRLIQTIQALGRRLREQRAADQVRLLRQEIGVLRGRIEILIQDIYELTADDRLAISKYSENLWPSNTPKKTK